MNEFPYGLPLVLDGATGTCLAEYGLDYNKSTDFWCFEHTDEVSRLQSQYKESGSDAVYTATFTANETQLDKFGYGERVTEINEKIAGEARKNLGKDMLIGGDISTTGLKISPFGENDFAEIVAALRKQARALDPYVDFFAIETMSSLYEMRAAVIACKRLGKPIFVTMTVDEDGLSPTDADALACLITMQSMGVDAFGLNCGMNGLDPEQMADVIRRLYPYARIPLIAKPCNGGNGTAALSPTEFAEQCKSLLKCGAQIIGGCCGTTPEHIREIRKLVDDFDFSSVNIEKYDGSLMFASELQPFFLDPESTEISEPLTCTSDMSEELIAANETASDVIAVEINSEDDAYDFADNAHLCSRPVMFVSEDYDALNTALRYYHGRAMIDKNTGIEQEKLEKLVEKYGAVIF